MTALVISIIMPMIVYSMACSSNPLILSMKLLLVSSAIFYSMFLSTGATWYPMLMQMLFMGGILIMFMVLSAVMPNEVTDYGTTSLFFISAIVLYALADPKKESESTALSMKMTLSVLPTSNFLAALVLLYFLSFVFILSEKETPLRTMICHSSIAL